MLNVSVNNESLQVQSPCNVTQLIELAGFAQQTIAVAINGEFIAKRMYQQTQINHNDNIDIVKPIGGG